MAMLFLISQLFTGWFVARLFLKFCLAICSQEQDFGVEGLLQAWLVPWLQDSSDGSRTHCFEDGACFNITAVLETGETNRPWSSSIIFICLHVEYL